ncbi:UNVERIFIED_CONTAM: transcriptional regulator with PAS, ATPase and Fis domain [Brevibacillus sp. OAP136]
MTENEWMSREAVCFLLFVSSTYQINLAIGDFHRVFQTKRPCIFRSHASITELGWSELFTDEPRLDLEQQILYTHDQQKMLLSITKVNEKEYEFVLGFTNLTRSSKELLVRGQHHPPLTQHELVWHSDKMKQILYIIEQVTHVDSTVLLLGESGVGKSAIAKAIHQMSLRKDKPFLTVNCGALPENLIESELFGYESGSFTGGKKGGQAGLFEAAHTGTLFLDEIAELPYNAQSKLLEVLQENTFRRVGGVKKVEVDVRVIAATNKVLPTMIKQNRFREDLFYRLNVVPLEIPPLRERKEDIPLLLRYFLNKFNLKYKKGKRLSEETVQRFTQHQWPGNIRELENLVERIVVTDQAEEVTFADATSPAPQSPDAPELVIKGIMPLKQAKRQLERELVTRAYSQFGSTYKAAKVLEVDQSTIVKKLKDYNLVQETEE